MGRLILAAIAVIVVCASSGFWLGGEAVARGALVGTLVGTVVQGVAAWLLLRGGRAAMSGFLGAFAGAALVRVILGAGLVFLALYLSRENWVSILAGFGIAYVVLEVVTNTVFVRNEDEMDPAA